MEGPESEEDTQFCPEVTLIRVTCNTGQRLALCQVPSWAHTGGAGPFRRMLAAEGNDPPRAPHQAVTQQVLEVWKMPALQIRAT